MLISRVERELVWMRPCSARARPSTRFRRSWTPSERRRVVCCSLVSTNRSTRPFACATAPSLSSTPLPHRRSWPPSSDARHRAGGDRHGRDLRSAVRPGSRADSGLRWAIVLRIYRRRRGRHLAPPRKDRGHSIVPRRHRRRGHGRGPRQRCWRPGFQPGDRSANVRRLWRRVGRRSSAARLAG